jgi:hypothetical protein
VLTSWCLKARCWASSTSASFIGQVCYVSAYMHAYSGPCSKNSFFNITKLIFVRLLLFFPSTQDVISVQRRLRGMLKKSVTGVTLEVDKNASKAREAALFSSPLAPSLSPASSAPSTSFSLSPPALDAMASSPKASPPSLSLASVAAPAGARGGSATPAFSSPSEIVEVHFDIPGIRDDVLRERDATYQYMKDLVTAHQIKRESTSSKVGDLAIEEVSYFQSVSSHGLAL